MNSELINKIEGMIYGALYGDSLGTPYEFNKYRTDACDIKLKRMKRFNRYQNLWKVMALGQYSDDTEMGLIILRHLLDNEMKYNATTVALEYMKWANGNAAQHKNGSPFMGKNTRALFGGVTTIAGYKKHYMTRFPSEQEMQTACSNGALMRCYPFAIMALCNQNYEKYLERDCKLTNPSKDVIAGNKMYIRAIVKALHGKSKKSILSEWVAPASIPDVTQERGLYSHALYCAFSSLKDFDNYHNAIKNIISLGGDTDTNACIAGALLGAYYGFAKLNENTEFRDNLEIMLNCNSEDGDFVRPEEYSPRVLKSLVEKLRTISDHILEIEK